MTAKLQHVQLIQDQRSNHVERHIVCRIASDTLHPTAHETSINTWRWSSTENRENCISTTTVFRQIHAFDRTHKSIVCSSCLQMRKRAVSRKRLLIIRCQSVRSCAGPRAYYCRRPHVSLRMSTAVKHCIVCVKLTMKHDRYYTRTKRVCFELHK